MTEENKKETDEFSQIEHLKKHDTPLYYCWLLKLYTICGDKTLKNLTEGLTKTEYCRFLCEKAMRPDIHKFLKYLIEKKILNLIENKTFLEKKHIYAIDDDKLEEEIEEWNLFMKTYNYIDMCDGHRID
jgi:hypothetical protein